TKQEDEHLLLERMERVVGRTITLVLNRMDRINAKHLGAPEGSIDGKDDDNDLQPTNKKTNWVSKMVCFFFLKKNYLICEIIEYMEDNDNDGGILRPNKPIQRIMNRMNRMKRKRQKKGSQEHPLEIKNLRDVPMSFLGAPLATAVTTNAATEASDTLSHNQQLEVELTHLDKKLLKLDTLIENTDDRLGQRAVLEAIDKDAAIVRLLDNCVKFLTDSYFLSILLNFFHLDKPKNALNCFIQARILQATKKCNIFKNFYNTLEKGINLDVYVITKIRRNFEMSNRACAESLQNKYQRSNQKKRQIKTRRKRQEYLKIFFSSMKQGKPKKLFSFLKEWEFVSSFFFVCSFSCFFTNKMIEVLTIEIDQAGIQLGNAIWEQYCAEHTIDNGGKRKESAERMTFLRCSLKRQVVKSSCKYPFFYKKMCIYVHTFVYVFLNAWNIKDVKSDCK
ncbi:hypothetical protein RFI_26716, partial [Reticulomyxa filosa]